MDLLPHNVVISGVQKANDACAWCTKHFNKKDWDITIPFIGQASYAFRFSNDIDANWFKLKWQ